jgi:hypothetical protein
MKTILLILVIIALATAQGLQGQVTPAPVNPTPVNPVPPANPNAAPAATITTTPAGVVVTPVTVAPAGTNTAPTGVGSFGSVISAILAEPYTVALLSAVVIVAAMI